MRALSDLHNELVALYGYYLVMDRAINEWRNKLNLAHDRIANDYQ